MLEKQDAQERQKRMQKTPSKETIDKINSSAEKYSPQTNLLPAFNQLKKENNENLRIGKA